MLILGIHPLHGQFEAQPPSEDTISYLNMKADEALHVELPDVAIDTLHGNVEIVQDSLFMKCDHAVIKDKIHAEAWGNVLIIHEDSVYIYSDHLDYDGENKIAVLTGQVILEQEGKYLHTSELIYDVNTKQASFLEGGTLIENDSRLQSKEGYYDAKRQIARFKTNVKYTDTTKVVLTDSMIYHYNENRLDIIAPTKITQDSTEIYCEEGIYNIDSDDAVLQRNVQVITDGKLITSELLHYDGQEKNYTLLINPQIQGEEFLASADTIFYHSPTEIVQLRHNADYLSESESVSATTIIYDIAKETYLTEGNSTVSDEDILLSANQITKDESNRTIAIGNVTFTDTTSNTSVTCQFIELVDSIGLSKAYNSEGQPMLVRQMDDDSLVILADTLFMVQFRSDSLSYDRLSGNKNATLFKGQMSGKADSLSFTTLDSILSLFGNPIMWTDSTQMSADTIDIALNGGEVDFIDLKVNAMIVMLDEQGHFNQIAGHAITNYVNENELSRSKVNGNSQLVYFVINDEDQLEGVNQSKSNSMMFTFKGGELDKINFYRNPESKIIEYQEGMTLDNYNLQGFLWRIDEKPLLLQKSKFVALNRSGKRAR